jgi:hypothetical protein
MPEPDAEYSAFMAQVREVLDDPRFGGWLRMLGPGEPGDTLALLWMVHGGVYAAAGVEPPALTAERPRAAVVGMNARLRAAGLPVIGVEEL